MALIMVGAMIVAGIDTVWSGQIAPPPGEPITTSYTNAPEAIELGRGAELGRFKLGSTVILLFPRDAVSFASGYTAGTPVKMGTSLGTIR